MAAHRTNQACDADRSGLATALDYAFVKVATRRAGVIGVDYSWACDPDDSGAANAHDLDLTRGRVLQPVP